MPSKRQMRRAQQRHGDIVFEQEVVAKHSKGRKKRKPKPASTEHLRKLRSLYLRADILVVPYSEKEVKELMQKAREEYATSQYEDAEMLANKASDWARKVQEIAQKSKGE